MNLSNKNKGVLIMGETLLAVLGFITIVLVIVLLLKNVTTPAMAFISVSTLAAIVLVATGSFSISEVGDFIKKGVNSTSPTACLFLFSVVFFGIMTDAGMFDKIIGALLKRVGSNVMGVAIMTCIVAMIAHLDGAGAATFLITVPAMLPIYKKLHMRRTTLLLICVTAMGVMNLMPWGGPTMRAASVLAVDANDLWMKILPMQVVGIVIAFLTAIFWGRVEVKRGAGLNGKLAQSGEDVEEDDEETEGTKDTSLARPQFFAFNLILTLAVIVGLIVLDVPTYLVFMVGCALALFVNYRGSKLQGKVIKRHADSAIMMASTLFGAGVFLGVLEDSNIMDAMANILAGCMPAAMGPFLPILIGVLSAPLALAFSTDAYFYGLLPVLISVGNAFNVDPVQTAIAMVVCRNCAAFISPNVPATFLGCGLAGIDIKDHIKATFLWVWGVSAICLFAGVLFGIM